MLKIYLFIILFSLGSAAEEEPSYTLKMQTLINKTINFLSLKKTHPLEMIRQMSLLTNEMEHLAQAYWELMRYALDENRDNDTESDKFIAFQLINNIHYLDPNSTDNLFYSENAFLRQFFYSYSWYYEPNPGHKTNLDRKLK